MIPALRPLALLVGLTAILVACAPTGTASQTPGEPSAVAGSPAVGGDCPTSEPAPLAAGESRNVTIDTELGEILIHVEGDLSPIAAGNFVALAECGFYDGVVFHRVVPGFVIQGGDGQYGRSPDVDPSSVGTGGPGYTITDEPVMAIYKRGIVAMARTQQPNSVGSQFFIVLDDGARTSLEAANTYQIIGAVANGMETADAIAEAADAEIPTNPVVMTDVSVAAN
jgi:cyclophilin family peptidyl-prolyl cis-trans isomerase